ncbi:hypothetical protein [Emticicia sp. 21SJ11W-3]|uniref:Nmad2 family putative nucleotide modification protein n=1 Tax=Emticicia sp. 21SJ11W-3 TaxID=2916755 RepID=UPI00209DB502|nr:hypothetical protein [Emticicia sp. 21SJ11W-3]UTA66510.1 hypothetical protein MB380_12965 [Emticicia sp. 21SJ11W-3]
MTKIYSYVLRLDDGSAPNPFGGICTLTICKPVIRRTAHVGDWVIGTGSKNVVIEKGTRPIDFSDSLVYAMKITDIKTLQAYDEYCRNYLPVKIGNKYADDWHLKAGDCIYDYTSGKPVLRVSSHDKCHTPTDLSGQNALLSDHFYYFGLEARRLPDELKDMIKISKGHKIIEQPALVAAFENWIAQFEKNKLYADPQRRWFFDRPTTEMEASQCAKEKLETEEDDMEERHC